ncbi:hypothetical protein PG999_001436 [Apiospora kogelbergensis]|uniref:Major facilitator superfamily (MFS) profile domain-containing protein n=1 Tax=Apiospora kogelbergensis TaxID=1337665 RepID=A0AAW0REK0_9PEZI
MSQLKERDPYAFPTKQLTVLAICRFSEPIAFNSILAYTFEMVKDLEGAGAARDAPFYAGLLVSAYAVAEALTAMGWGALSDRVGRKPVVLFGLGGVALSSLLFGLSKRYWVALLARFVGGALNGNVSVMQTMVAEMVRHPAHEPRAYATQPFVWTLGGILGSAMGGFLAQPARFYPRLFPADGLFGRYPYLLPNLVAVAVVVLAIVQGLFFLEETNPRSAREAAAAAAAAEEEDEDEDGLADDDFRYHYRQQRRIDDAIAEEEEGVATAARRRSSLLSTSLSRPRFIEDSLPVPVEPSFDLRRSSFGTVHSIRVGHGTPTTAATAGEVRVIQPSSPTPPSSGTSTPTSSKKKREPGAFNFTIVMLTLALVLVSYHQMAFNTLLPTHLLDPPSAGYEGGGRLDLRGGLGYTVHDVGVYLAVNGVLGLLIQGVVFPPFVDRVGVWRSFVWMVALYPLAYLAMPFVSAFAAASPPQSAAIYLSLVLQSFFGIILTPCALILLKDAAPSPRPPLAGVIYAAGGSAAAWFSCAAFALLGVLQLLWVPRSRNARDLVVVEVENALVQVDSRQQQQQHSAADGANAE